MEWKLRVNLAACGAVVALALTGCAIGNEDRRLVLSTLDSMWSPSSTTGRVLWSPVAVPVGLAGGLTDAVLVHPASQIDDAWLDTADAVWSSDHGSDFRNVLFAPLSAVATPVVFGVVWAWRSVFDMDDYPDAEPSVGEESK